MQSLARMLSRASSAEDDLAYLTKTMPLAAIKSILQYSRSLNFDISPWTGIALDVPFMPDAGLHIFCQEMYRMLSRGIADYMCEALTQAHIFSNLEAVSGDSEAGQLIELFLMQRSFPLTSMILPSAVLGTTMKSRDLGGMLSGSAAISVSGCLVTVPERLRSGQNAPWLQAWSMLPVATGLL